MRAYWFILAGLGLCAPLVDGAESAQAEVSVHYPSLRWLHPPQRVGSVCGDALFSLEADYPSPRLVCLKADPASGQYTAASARTLDSIGSGQYFTRLVRSASSVDPSVVLWAPPALLRFDLRDESISTIVRFAETNLSVGRIHLFDREGDGGQEVMLVLDATNSIQIRGIPGGEIQANLYGGVWTNAWESLVVGQFDTDPAAEIALWGASGLTLYDARDLRPQGPAIASPVRPLQGRPRAVDFDSDGRDEILFEAMDGSVGVVDFDGTVAVHRMAMPGDDIAHYAQIVDWIEGGGPEVAVVGDRSVAVFDPRTRETIDAIEVPPDIRPRLESGYEFGSDIRGRTSSALLWRSATHLVEWRRGNAARQNTQAVESVAAVSAPPGTSGNDTELVTVIVGQGDAEDYGASVVQRDPISLQRRRESQIPESRLSTLSVGDASDSQGREVFALRRDRMSLYGVDGQLLWREVLPETLREYWGISSMPTHACAAPSCRRILIERRSMDGTAWGTKLMLIDSSDGATLWTGPGDNCSNCWFTSLKIGDIDGDNSPEMLSVKPWNSNEQVELRDGATFALRWQRTFLGNHGPVDVDIAGSAERTIVFLRPTESNEIELMRIAAATGATLSTRVVPLAVSDVTYLPVGVSQGRWLLGGYGSATWLLNEDLSGELVQVDHAGILSASGTETGDAYLARIRSIHPVSIPGERLLRDGFER